MLEKYICISGWRRRWSCWSSSVFTQPSLQRRCEGGSGVPWRPRKFRKHQTQPLSWERPSPTTTHPESQHVPHAVFWLFLVFTTDRIIGLSENQTDYSSFQGNEKKVVVTGDFEQIKRRCNPMASQQQQPPMEPPFKNHVYYVPEGCLLVNVRHGKSPQKKIKLACLSRAILLQPSKRNKQSQQKEKAHAQQQLPS